MAMSVRLPPRVEQELARYCASNGVSKSEAVKRALEQLFAQAAAAPDVRRASARFAGSDKTPGNVALRSKQLLRRYAGQRRSVG